VAVAMLVWLLFDVVGVKAVPMRCWSAAVNGVLPPPLMAPILLLTSGRAVMGGKWRARRDSNAAPPLRSSVIASPGRDSSGRFGITMRPDWPVNGSIRRVTAA